ncbi:MAG: class I SAM-dependent methyltransferase [Gammaproteobacteria bacterium]|nr:class I SAM-dependent methyltransferase [Gammaproteobacteria bacterium]
MAKTTTNHKLNAEDPEWLDHLAKFSQVYEECNYGDNTRSFVMRAGHRFSEKQFSAQDKFNHVIEVGAGTGEHIQFVKHQFERYTMTDANPSALALAEKKAGNTYGNKVSFEIHSGEKLKYKDNTFDRLIAAHVLEHIYKPHLAIKEWIRVVKNGGVITLLLPTDPGMAWRFARHFGPRRDALSRGIAYDYVMAREHVNSCTNLIALLRHYLPNRAEKWWPTPIPSVDLNLFYIYHAFVNKP